MMILSTLMPIRRAVSGSWEVACMARPSRVRLTKKNRKTVQMARAIEREQRRPLDGDAADAGSPGR